MVLSTQIPASEGIGRHVVDLARRLRDRGHQLTLMTRGDCRGTREITCEGFRVIRAAFWPLYPLHVQAHRLALERTLEHLDFVPDLVHLHSPLVPPLKKKWPVVATFHSPMLTTTASLEQVGIRAALIKLMGKTTSYWIEKKLLAVADAVIAVSSGVAQELRHFYHFNGAKLFTILNCVDSSLFKPGPENNKARRLLFVGRLDYGKGLFDLVNAAPAIIKAHPDVKLVVVGGGPLLEKLQTMVQELRLADSFLFQGAVYEQNEIVRHYQEAYAVLLPSHYESFSLVLREAMACGKPVVAAKAAFVRGVLQDGVNALLVQPGSPGELAAAAIRLLDDAPLAARLGRAARRTVKDSMDSAAHTRQVLETYRFALEQFARRTAWQP